MTCLQVHSACIDQLELKEANTRECMYRDLWHMILVPRAVSYRMSVKNQVETEREPEEGERGRESVCVCVCVCVCVRAWREL